MQPSPDPSSSGTLSRRAFMAAAAGASVLAAMPASAEDVPKPQEFKRKIKLGVVGCGGRGAWIANLFKQHGGYEMHGVADYFPDAADACGNALGVDKARRFSGLSGYKKLIESGIEAIALIDVPYFIPEQAKAAVDAGCHVYTAKPMAVDVPGCLAIEVAAREATKEQRAFLVDYQLPTEPANIEVANRIRQGALGPIAHIVSFGLCGAWADPAKGPTIEGRLRGEIWLSDIALGGDNIVSYDIHIIDGVTWAMGGKRPVAAWGRSRTCRPNPNGDRTDAGGIVFEYDDGVIWTHVTQALNNNCELTTLTASLYGQAAMAHIGYGGKVFVKSGDEKQYYVGTIGSIYDQGAVRNIADFYRNVTEGHFENPIAQRAVDGTLTAILGREAAARGTRLTMEALIKENKKLEVDLKGLKA